MLVSKNGRVVFTMTWGFLLKFFFYRGAVWSDCFLNAAFSARDKLIFQPSEHSSAFHLNFITRNSFVFWGGKTVAPKTEVGLILKIKSSGNNTVAVPKTTVISNSFAFSGKSLRSIVPLANTMVYSLLLLL